MNRTRIILLLVLIAVIAGIVSLDTGNLLSLEGFQEQRSAFEQQIADNFALSAGLFFLAYVTVAALNIPGAAVMTLIAGALFGLTTGTVLVSFASSIGATLAFLLSRYLLRSSVEKKFSGTAERINQGLEREGGYYLFGLRLVPLFPFFAINIAMGLTRFRTWPFYWISQIGMFPATVVYVNAGTRIGELESTAGILSPALIFSFVLLGVFPLIARRLLDAVKRRRAYKGHAKPKTFDTNLIVIGAGSAGLVTAYIAAAAGARVTLIEREKMGGDCLNTGCVPSKALIQAARTRHSALNASRFGIEVPGAETRFRDVMKGVHEVIDAIEPHDSVERYTSLGVDCLAGNARLTDPWSVDVDGKTLTAPNIVIATGASPAVPPIPGLADVPYLTSETLWELTDQPKSLAVLGGGAIGCELAQAFARLGTEVTVIEMLPNLLANEDPDVSELVEAGLSADGVRLLTGFGAKAVESGDEGITITCERDGEQTTVQCSHVLVATGRRANTADLGLEELGIALRPNGTVDTDDYLRTALPNVFACGDVTGPLQLTNASAHQAWYASVNALFGAFRKFSVDYRVIPRAVFCSPEVARVGLNRKEADAQGVAYDVTRYGLDDLDRAIADREAEGFVEVLTPPGSDKLLGVTIVGPHAADVLSEFTLAMRHGLGLNKILGTVHIYPTLSEGNKFAAGIWRKERISERLLNVSRRYLNWRRG